MLTLRRAVMVLIIGRISLFLELVDGADRRIINSAARLLPDQSHLVQHLKAVGKQSYLAALVVVPAHRNLFESQTGAKSQIQQLDIKSKPIDRSSFDQRPAHAHAKSFEAALRVPERHSRGQTNNQIKDASTLFAAPRLVHYDQIAVQRSRSERDATLPVLNRLDQLFLFGNGRRKIGVGKQRDISARSQQAESDGSPLAEIRLVSDDRGAQVSRILESLSRKLGGFIR